MKLEKYEDKSRKKRKIVLISISVIVLISVSLLLYKTFASLTESAEFPMMKGQVDYFGNSDVYFAFYQGDKKLEEMPKKDNEENLVFDHAECDNGASIEWNKEEWAPLVKNLKQAKTKCSLYFGYPTAVEFLNNLGKKDTTNLIADDTNEANVRYVGASPNNYIDIGDRDGDGQPILWQIIGVMNNITNLDNAEQQESLVKIIRSESIGKYSWDTSTVEMNNTSGINEWSQSDIMKLLNPNTVYSGTPEIGRSLYWNRGSGRCYNNSDERHISCNFTNIGISETAKKKIAKIRWNTGTKGEAYDDSKITAKYMYEGERSTHNGKEQCESNGGGNACNDTIPRITTWDGYIGLIYPSDYGYAVGGEVRDACLEKSMHNYDGESCATNDWLKSSIDYSWTMTPVPYSSRSDYVFHISLSGAVNGDLSYSKAHLGHRVQPVVYLKSSTKITGGTGEIDSPFIAQ